MAEGNAETGAVPSVGTASAGGVGVDRVVLGTLFKNFVTKSAHTVSGARNRSYISAILNLRLSDIICGSMICIKLGYSNWIAIGWNTLSVAKYYIGATSSKKVHGSKRKRDQSCASASELLLSPEFQKQIAVCARTD